MEGIHTETSETSVAAFHLSQVMGVWFPGYILLELMGQQLGKQIYFW